ncbi:sulfotransferase [Flagellimonas marinaquae]
MKNILVTGSHRSGSTWVGQVLAKASGTRYIHEPFNLKISREESPVQFWFESFSCQTEERQKEAAHYIESFYDCWHVDNIKRLRQLGSVKEGCGYALDFVKKMTRRTIIKDPIAVLSADWLYENFQMDIVVLIRHPAAFVASLKVKGWSHDFTHFLQQPNLLEGPLQAYKSDIETFAVVNKSIIDQGILLWNIIYGMVCTYQQTYGRQWCFFKHESLSRNPIVEFKKLFSYVDLKFDAKVKQYILETTQAEETSHLERNSLENMYSWKERLTLDEIAKIKKGTAQIWKKFYEESDW